MAARLFARLFARRRAIVLYGAVLVAATVASLAVLLQPAPTPPADRFIAGLTRLDADAVWESLCPELQAQAPRDALAAAFAARKALGVTPLSWRYAGALEGERGGQVRFYLVRGPGEQTPYTLWTRPSGCVERFA